MYAFLGELKQVRLNELFEYRWADLEQTERQSELFQTGVLWNRTRARVNGALSVLIQSAFQKW